MNKHILATCLVAATTVGLASQAQAALFTGEVSNLRNGASALVGDNDLDASGNAWAATGGSTANKGVRLSFSVDKISNSDWAYSYTFVAGSTAQKQVGHFDLEVGAGFTPGSLLSWSSSVAGTTGPDVGTTAAATLSEPTGTVASPFNRSLFGLQWLFPTNTFAFTITLHSSLAPIWGDFIVESSETTANPPTFLAAWNHGLGSDTNAAIVTGNDAAGYALVPGAVPVPASLPMLIGALGLLGVARRRRG